MGSDDRQSVEATNPLLGSLKVSGANVNTLFTVASFILLAIACWILQSHAGDAKDGNKEVARELKESNERMAKALKESNKELGEILKELAQSTREQNCLLSLPQDRRPANAEVCKRISR